MTTFAVTDQSQVIDALNYALSNLGTSSSSGNGTSDGNAVTINTTTGVIGQGGTVLSYLYRYLTIRYGTSASGAGITTNPIGATYFGVYNNNSETPPDANNPSNYQWTQTSAPLSSTNLLWYSTLGGRQVQFFVGTEASLPQPTTNWVQVSNDPVDLDFVTATAVLPLVVMTAYIAAANANVVPSTPTGGTYDFSNLNFTPPSGWSNSIPANSTAFFSSQNQFQASPLTSIVAPGLPWTTPVITGQIGANGANGANGTNGANGVSTYFYNVFQSANSAPPSPTGGYYNFSTSTGTPPSGWSNTATSPNGAPIWAVSATVSSTNPNANVAVSSWSSTFQYTGAGGAPGSRGPVPMGYVLTPSDPRVASSSTLSQWFQAGTGGVVAPVGIGLPPVDQDTASFTWSANTQVAPVYTYNSGNTTWTAANGQVINGNVFITGSVNANRLNANDVYAIKTASTNANVGNNQSNGYWFDSTTGNARIAGNVSIGNNLVIGNNANIGSNLTIGNNLSLGANINIGNNAIIGNNCAIGGNLNVAGLISSSGLNANTVNTITVVPNAVTATDYFGTGYNVIQITNPTLGLYYGAGQWQGVNCSTSGSSANILTVPTPPSGSLLTDMPFLVGDVLVKTAGNGTVVGTPYVLSINSGTQATITSGTISSQLSGATLRGYPIMRTTRANSMPGIYVTTTGANQAVQVNFTGEIGVNAIPTSLVGGWYATLAVIVNIVRYNFSNNAVIDDPVNQGVNVFQQILTFPMAFIDNVPYGMSVGFSFSSIIDIPNSAGTYVYSPTLNLVPFQGTWTASSLYLASMYGSGTVLKR